MIAQELEVSLHMAFVEARQKQHEFITVEHLLLAMLDNPSAAEVLKACGVDLDELRGVLTDFINEHTPRLSPHSDADTQPTQGFQRVIQRAILHVQSSGKKEVTGANVLVAIFGEKESHAVYFLNQRGVTRLDVVNYIAHGITKNAQQKQEKGEAKEEGEGASESQGALDSYTVNLNTMAKAGKIDPLIGREQELERVIQVLCAAGARTIRCWSARPAWARPRSPKGSRAGSTSARCRSSSRITRFTRSTWARCWRAPSTAAISSSA